MCVCVVHEAAGFGGVGLYILSGAVGTFIHSVYRHTHTLTHSTLGRSTRVVLIFQSSVR